MQINIKLSTRFISDPGLDQGPDPWLIMDPDPKMPIIPDQTGSRSEILGTRSGFHAKIQKPVFSWARNGLKGQQRIKAGPEKRKGGYLYQH